MIIPTIKSIDIRGIRPFDIHGGKIKFSEGVSYFCRENGRGKTTLIDLIKLNLFRLNYIDEYKSIQEKIYPDPTGTKIIEHYVSSVWDFGSKKVKIKQELNRSGITSYINGEWEKEPNFNETLIETFQANLTVNQMIELYQILVFIEERSTDKNLIQDWENFTEDALPELVLESDKFSFLKDYRHFLRKEKELNRSFDHLNADFKQSKELLKEFIEEVKVIPEIKEKILDHTSKLDLETKNLNNLQTKKSALSEKRDNLQRYQNQIAEKRRKLEKISEIKQSVADLKRLEFSFSQKAAKNAHTSNLKEDYRKSHGTENCPVCNTGEVLGKWDTTIINSQRCPLCKIPLDRVPESIKENLFLSAKTEREMKKKSAADVKKSLKQADKQLNQSKADLDEINTSLNKMDITFSSPKGSVESEILGYSSQIMELDKQLGQSNIKIQQLTASLSKEQNTLAYLDQVRVKIRNKEALRKNKERLDTVRKDLEYTSEFLTKNKDLYEETASSLESLKQRIMVFIKSESLRLLNFEFQFDANSKNLILPGGEIRYFNSCSGGEKHFADFCLRVLVWMFLVTEGKQRKGLLILDNPGAIISKSYISLFKDIITKTQDDIQYIITSNNANLYEKDFYLIQELKTKVKTLMDFML